MSPLAATKPDVMSAYRWIAKMARQLTSDPVFQEDLTQQGMLGAMRAAETYDPARGSLFLTYAHWWARAYISKLGRTIVAYSPYSKPAMKARRGEVYLDAFSEAISEQIVGSCEVEDDYLRCDLSNRVRAVLQSLYDTLSPLEQDIIRNRLLADCPDILETIGSRHGVSREWIRLCEQRLKKRLATVFLARGFA